MLVPFHAFLTVWLSSFIDNYTALRLWKEVLLLMLVCVAALYILHDNKVWRSIAKNRLAWWGVAAILLYIALHLLLSGWAFIRNEVAPLAIGYSLVSNTRFLLFFIVCMVAGIVWRDWFIQRNYALLFIPAGLVVAFGLLQFTVLPVDFLKHFGYSNDTIQPYIAVDEKVEYARVQSTTRGPNPLGAYLVIVAAVIAGVVLARRKMTWLTIVGLLAVIVVLYASYSRSAYLGALIAIGLTVFFLLQSQKARKILLYSGLVVGVVASMGLFALRDNDTVQNVVFHTDEHSISQASSNESRLGALQSATSDVISQPFGGGPGSAGPASVYNNEPKISENYFLQIGQETGVPGMVLFIGICVMVSLTLWSMRSRNPLASIWLAIFVGISFINLISHAWADDTLAYVWWGFAGLIIGAELFKETQKNEAKTK